MSDQEDTERDLATEYFEFKSANLRNLQVLSEFCPNHGALGVAGPDVRAICTLAGIETTVGIELTEYQVDRGPGGSMSMRAAAIWSSMLDRFRSEHFKQFPDLACLEVFVSLDKVNLPRRSELPNLTDEFARFLDEHSSDVSGPVSFHRWGQRSNEGDFERHQLLKQHVQRITVCRTSTTNLSRQWQLADVAHVGIIADEVAWIISSKAGKNLKYDFSGMDERWLLIHASGTTSSAGAGPAFTQLEKLASPEICTTAGESGFDRVVFWERVEGWDFEIPHGSPQASR